VSAPAAWRRPAATDAARLAALGAWRRGTRIALGLAPSGAVAGLLRPVAAAATLGAAVLLAAVVERAARAARYACALHPELRGLPEVAAERARLAGPVHRGRLAAELRRTAGRLPRSGPERRMSPYPPERLAAARAGLLELADAVEGADGADPAVLDDVRTLLRDGTRSPLLNVDMPAGELPAAIRRARFRLATDPPAVGRHADPARRPAEGRPGASRPST
jgi:hypothetical protein